MGFMSSSSARDRLNSDRNRLKDLHRQSLDKIVSDLSEEIANQQTDDSLRSPLDGESETERSPRDGEKEQSNEDREDRKHSRDSDSSGEGAGASEVLDSGDEEAGFAVFERTGDEDGFGKQVSDGHHLTSRFARDESDKEAGSSETGEEIDSLIDSVLDSKRSPKAISKLSQLDSLVNRTSDYFKYRGNLEAQIGIAETALMVGCSDAGRAFNLDPSQSWAYEHSLRTPVEKEPKKELDAALKIIKQDLALKAASRLGDVLDILDGEKIKKIAKATDLARVGKDMAVILDKVSPKDQAAESGLHLHLYRPEQREAKTYDVVPVSPSTGSGVESDSIR